MPSGEMVGARIRMWRREWVEGSTKLQLSFWPVDVSVVAGLQSGGTCNAKGRRVIIAILIKPGSIVHDGLELITNIIIISCAKYSGCYPDVKSPFLLQLNDPGSNLAAPHPF